MAIAFSSWAAGTSHAKAECTDRNLLAHMEPAATQGVVRPEVLTDGRIPVQGSTFDSEHTARFLEENAHVTFDLGETRTVRALYLQADNNDEYIVSISDDGKQFEPAFRAPAVDDPGMQGRVGLDFEWRARFVRLQPKAGDGNFSVSELALYCQRPEPFPPELEVVAVVAKDPIGKRVRLTGSWKAALALGLIPVLLLMARMRRRPRAALALALVILGAFAWVRFGQFHVDGVLHPWDSFHYFVGSKYFDELGYTELYNCLAQHEREQGRGEAIVQGGMRDLRTNVKHGGRWSLEPEARCRADFGEKRAAQYHADLESFRELFPDRLPFHRVVVDHGYNATPPHTALLKAFTHFTPASRASVIGLSFLDFFAYLGAFAMLWWGFGPRTAALGALFVGLGEPWSYLWTGGSVGRAVWLFFLCAGLALLARRRQALGGASLTLAGVLRLFPGVFVGALGLFVLVRSIRDRTLSALHRRTLAAIFGTLAAALVIAGVVAGFEAYPAFVRNTQSHTELVMANHLGLEHLMSYVPGARSATVGDQRLTDPYQVLKAMQSTARSERWPLWALAIGASLALLIAYALRRRARAWVAVVLAAPLLYSSIALSNYDYVWLIVLAPIAITSRFRIIWLMSYVASTQVISLYVKDVEIEHMLLSLFTGVTLAVIVAHHWRHTASDPEAEARLLEAERAGTPTSEAPARG
ncbi:MAG: hypothetical protein ACOCXM_08220 [Myxococcota bacterium]